MLAEPRRCMTAVAPMVYVKFALAICVGGIVHCLQFEATVAIVIGFVLLIGVMLIGLLRAAAL
jgi:hypothetical protein